MRVFLTGASGFIGSAITKELIGAGHQVIGLARSEKSAKSIIAAGAEVHFGSLDDLESLKHGAAKSDGIIHTAFIHSFSNISLAARLKVIFGGLPASLVSRFLTTIAEMDRKAIETMGSVLTGSSRPLVITSGTLILTPGRLVNEKDGPDPKGPAAYRTPSEIEADHLSYRRVRCSIVRLPPTVHGDRDTGFLPNLIKTAQKKGVSGYVNDGFNLWPAVHRLDAANLFRLALEKGTAGSTFHGVAEEGIKFREIAEVIGKRLSLPVERRPEKHFGHLGEIVAADNKTSAILTKEKLGWTPRNPSLLQDLEFGQYFK